MKSEARKIAELQCRTQLESQALGLLADPLWSTILGFAAIHKMRKEEWIGPVADDVLYAGIIAINAARSPGIQDLAGKGIEVAGLLGAGAAGAITGKVLGGGAAAGGAAAGGAAAGGAAAAGAAAAGAAKSWRTRLITAGSALGLGAGATGLLFGGGRKIWPKDTPQSRAKYPGLHEYHEEYGKWPTNAQLKSYRAERGI